MVSNCFRCGQETRRPSGFCRDCAGETTATSWGSKSIDLSGYFDPKPSKPPETPKLSQVLLPGLALVGVLAAAALTAATILGLAAAWAVRVFRAVGG